MDCSFGDIVDYRKDPSLNHFILVLGVDNAEKRILYAIITSRVYRAFERLCVFFNAHCLETNCYERKFHNNFKDRIEIQPVNLSDVFFLSKNIYSGTLCEDSMVILNRDPYFEDFDAFDALWKNHLINYANKLTKEDMIRLYVHIRTSPYFSKCNLEIIENSFKIAKGSL